MEVSQIYLKYWLYQNISWYSSVLALSSFIITVIYRKFQLDRVFRFTNIVLNTSDQIFLRIAYFKLPKAPLNDLQAVFSTII